MEDAPIVWLSVDPVRCKVDFYPKELAKRIEKVYQDYYILKNSNNSQCILGKDFFNAIINLEFRDTFNQTTPGASYGPRGGYKQPGYRSVRRIIVPPESKFIDILSHRVKGEWRITDSEFHSEIKFSEKVPEENILYVSEIIHNENENNVNDIPDLFTYWKPEDFENENITENMIKNVVVWQWCYGVQERQGNLMKLDDKWWKPYIFEQNKKIEEAFFQNLQTTTITLPFDNSIRNIIFQPDSCFGKQQNETGTKVRIIRRNIITVKKLIELLENENKKIVEPSDLSNYINENEIPHEFYCTISQDIMSYPVKTIDGFTYDRVSIEKWFENSSKSPLTGLNLSSKTLTPNNELRKQIEEFCNSVIQ